MTTRIGFFLLIGLVLGALVGNWLPYSPILETIAGGVIAVLAGFMLDRRAPENRSDAEG